MLKFTYTKPNGDVSERVAIMVTAASDNNLMLDVTELEEDEREDVLSDFEEYLKDVKVLRIKYGLDLYMKSFKSTRMSDEKEIK